MAVYPAKGLSNDIQRQIVSAACKIARELQVKGLMNIQFVVTPDDKVYVLEVNPRASRTVDRRSRSGSRLHPRNRIRLTRHADKR